MNVITQLELEPTYSEIAVLCFNHYATGTHLYYMTQLPWWLIVLIILFSGLVGPRVFQFAVKFAKIFEQKYKPNWKFDDQHKKTKYKQNGYMTCHRLYSGNENSDFGTGVRWSNNLPRWHHTPDILNLDR